MSQLEGSQAGGIPSLRGGSAFCFVQAFTLLDGAHLHWSVGWGQPALLGLPIQMLLASKNTPIETPRIMFDQVSGLPMAWSRHIKLTITPS